jgi:uncharacterized surface protein with fasciclin (FAS1) repeats
MNTSRTSLFLLYISTGGGLLLVAFFITIIFFPTVVMGLRKNLSSGQLYYTGISSSTTLAMNLQHQKNFLTFTAALQDSGLFTKLQEQGPYTLFVPSNAAFDVLSSTTLQHMIGKANAGYLKKILDSHIVEGIYNLSTIDGGAVLTAHSGEKILIARNGEILTVNDIPVIASDLPTSNGVMHIIEQVIVP